MMGGEVKGQVWASSASLGWSFHHPNDLGQGPEVHMRVESTPQTSGLTDHMCKLPYTVSGAL